MFSIIVSTAENNVIGKNNKLPWHLPKDLKRFANLTKGHRVIMGRSTYKSILDHLGKPLPERTNVVVTRNPNFTAPGCVIVHSLEEGMADASDTEEVFIIGGETIYRAGLPYAGRIYRTIVHAAITGDSFFPEIQTSEWTLIKKEFTPKDEKNQFDTTFVVYERVRNTLTNSR